MNANNISFENVSSNSTALPSINKPLATVGGCIGLAACLIGQRYAAPGTWYSTAYWGNYTSFHCSQFHVYVLLYDTDNLHSIGSSVSYTWTML